MLMGLVQVAYYDALHTLLALFAHQDQSEAIGLVHITRCHSSLLVESAEALQPK